MERVRVIALLAVSVGECVAGVLLALLLPLIREHPYVLALYPIVAAARGNIYASLGSRLSSRLHLGVIDARSVSRVYLAEAPRVLLQGMLSALVSASVAYTAVVLAEERLYNPMFVYGAALLTPLVTAPVLTGFTVALAIWGFRRGLDPDEYVAPLTTLAADVVVLPVLAGAALTAERLGPFALAPLALTPVIYVRLCSEDRRVLAENLSAISAASLVELARSYILVRFLPLFERMPELLAILPAFNAENGAALSTLASRLSTMLHLGLYKFEASTLLADAARLYASLAPAYMLTCTLATLGLGRLDRLPLLAPYPLAAGALVVTLMTLATHAAAKIGFTLGLDPDNILIPLVSSITDSLGTTIIVYMASLA